MLSSPAHTLRQKARLAVSLAMVGGFVDAACFLVLNNVFTSNMTGNTALLGARLAEQSWGNALFCAFVIGMFFIGATVSGVLTEGGHRRGYQSVYALALGVEAIVLGAFVLLDQGGVQRYYLLAALPAFAMGLQNATITQIAGSVVRTTHVTGVITDLGLESVQFLFWLRDRTRGRLFDRLRRSFYLSPRHVSVQRLFLLFSIWGSFLAGAAIGALCFAYWQGTALVLPIAFLLFMIGLDLVKPIAAVQAVNHFRHDDELKKYGIDPGLLPRSVMVYRVHARGRKGARPPDLTHLASRLVRRSRVLVLLLPPDVHIDNNTLMGLSISHQALQNKRCELVVCAIDAELYMRIRERPLGRLLGEANLCHDPEFAVARAIELVARATGMPPAAITTPSAAAAAPVQAAPPALAPPPEPR